MTHKLRKIKIKTKMFYLFRVIVRLLRMVIGRSCHQVNENEPMRLQMQKIREEHARKQKYDYSHVFRYETSLFIFIYKLEE